MLILKKIGIILFSVGIIGGIAYGAVSIRGNSVVNKKEQSEKKSPQTLSSLPIEIASDSGLDQAADAAIAWPGEIISPTALEVHPSSEGVINTLTVRVGQKVKAGHILGTLSAPPASMERAERSAERVEMLTKVRANAKNTTRLVTETKKQLTKELEALKISRSSALLFAEQDAQKDQFTNTNTPVEYEKMKTQVEKEIALAKVERDQARIQEQIKESKLRIVMRQMLEKDLPMISNNYIDKRTDWKTIVLRFKTTIGSLGQTRIQYEKAFRNLVRDLEDESSETLAENSLTYVQVMKNLAFATEAGDDVSDADIVALRKMSQANQIMVLDMANDVKEKKSMVAVKEAELEKMISRTEKELTIGSINVSTSKINTGKVESSRKKMIAEIEKEFIEKQREIETKIIELDREGENAQAEVLAVEAGYKTFTSQFGSQNIIAPKNGVVTGLFKTVGQYVMPSDSVALVSDGEQTKIFVRFRMPSDEQVLQRGDEVFVIRPGFPFDKQKAIVSGSGTTLDESGSYTVEAEFEHAPTWPLHSNVRVMSTVSSERILIPFTALTWDEEKKSHIMVVAQDQKIHDRIVQTGRAIGDKVEITSGLSVGEKYLSKQVAEDLLEGHIIKDHNNAEKKEEVMESEVDDTNKDKGLLEELDELDKQDGEMEGGHGHGE